MKYENADEQTYLEYGDSDGDMIMIITDTSFPEDESLLVEPSLPPVENEEEEHFMLPPLRTAEDDGFFQDEDSPMNDSSNNSRDTSSGDPSSAQHVTCENHKCRFADYIDSHSSEFRRQYQKLRKRMALTEDTRAKVIRQLGLSRSTHFNENALAGFVRSSRLGSMDLLLCTHERSGFRSIAS